MCTDATTGSLLRRANVTALWPSTSGLATWKMFGWNRLMSRLIDGGIIKGKRYSARPGTGSDGMLTKSPVGGKAGFSMVGE